MPKKKEESIEERKRPEVPDEQYRSGGFGAQQCPELPKPKQAEEQESGD